MLAFLDGHERAAPSPPRLISTGFFAARRMDDGHKFDENIVELYHVSKLLSVGGVLIIHDSWMPSVRKVRDRCSSVSSAYAKGALKGVARLLVARMNLP